MKKLLKETYEMRVETEEEAMALVEEERAQSKGIINSSITYKTKKSKGEIIEDWYVVKITRKYE